MLTVSIGFTTSKSELSRTIELATDATVSHAYIVFQDDASAFDHEIYEAAWMGFRMSTRAKLQSGSTRIVREVPVDIMPQEALAICRGWLETPYDYFGLLGELPVQVGKLFGQRWPNISASPHAMFCSEAACRLIKQCPGSMAVKRRVRNLVPRTTDPQMLMGALL